MYYLIYNLKHIEFYLLKYKDEMMDKKSKPKDIMLPLRAAMEAGVIRRPTWAEFIAEFGSKRASKGSLSSYTDTTKVKFDGEPQFMTMVEDFRRLTKQ